MGRSISDGTFQISWHPSSMVKTVFSTLSVLYCLLLLAIYIVPLATKLITPEKSLKSYGYYPESEVGHLGVLDGIHLYMFSLSVIVLFYLIYGLSRPSSSTSYQGSHTSAFVRVGAVFFGLGTIGHLALRLLEDVKNLAGNDENCKGKIPQMISGLIALVAVVMQMVAIIVCPRMKLKPGWGAPYFVTMHLVGGN